MLTNQAVIRLDKQKRTMKLIQSITKKFSATASFLVAAATLGGAVCPAAFAQTDSPIQSPARPLGLNIVNKVKIAGSDAASAQFQSSSLPRLRDLARRNLGERIPLSDSTVGLKKVDPNKIKLFTDAQVRAYFVGEGAGYRNSLGFNTQGGLATSGNPKLIFPDASTSVSESDLPGTRGTRSQSAPLMPGDFVDLGFFGANTQLHFFTIANGATGGTTAFTTEHDKNPDGIIHAVAYALPDSPYLLIGFKDLWGGGDRDYNDVLFTIDIGRANVAKLSGPEPGLPLVLGAPLGMTWLARRRQRTAASAVVRSTVIRK
ncbi:MAG: hypothetical protein OHK0029_12270 [Armatimonadaceae bacterium]